ncbi:uncharacterized protein B0H64DRAFT_416306 [Chaetomium fimeti]|uniref:Uncharacterized protein n=1 Tax=Chaetomium fimeti TaxID=1854472 RepID=A0AAE0HIF7_9PEZI|nr:hypothetical protein B0H64DRAFT_416306 [Chaetomium fimeti]
MVGCAAALQLRQVRAAAPAIPRLASSLASSISVFLFTRSICDVNQNAGEGVGQPGHLPLTDLATHHAGTSADTPPITVFLGLSRLEINRMPASRSSAQHPPRDSWLSNPMFLQPSIERDDAEIEDLTLSNMDEDPLMYFLTPAPYSCSGEESMDFEMEFDAGIEDAKRPTQIIRSVSPSSLEGLSRPPPRPPTPPRSPATPDLDYDLSGTPDEYEQYDYMESSWPPRRTSSVSLPRRLKDKFKVHHPKQDAGHSDSLVPPPPSPYPPRTSSRGRATSRTTSGSQQPFAASTTGRRSRAAPARLSPHAWREPSPDVWAIEEEPEAELHSEVGDGSFLEDARAGSASPVDIPAAKPKKRVRFVLPPMEDRGATY